MPFYYEIPDTPRGQRTAERLIALRKHLEAEIPPRTREETLLLGTWNIREFDSEKGGRRDAECLYYIAEIISRLDLVAVQEVRDNLEALERLARILGGHWRYIATDVTEGTPGNRERMAYLYDSRKVQFAGLAGEVVLPPVRDRENKVWTPSRQLSRTPFLTSWRSGWFKFQLCSVHIIWGSGGDESADRQEEVRLIAEFLKERATEKYAWSPNMILLGDFNIAKPGNKVFQKLVEAGFVVPERLQQLPSNANRDKFYDQIALLRRADGSDIALNQRIGMPTAGVFNYYQTVFRDEDEATYIADYNIDDYREWRTYQMSDHLPMWVEIKTDFADEYLGGKTLT